MISKKWILASLLLLVPHSAFAALKSTEAEENAIKVVKSAYRFDSVKLALSDWKRLEAKTVDLDASIKLLESTSKTIISNLASVRDEAKVGLIKNLAAITIDGVATEVLKLEQEVKSSELPFTAQDKANLNAILDLQKEVSGKPLVVEGPVEPSEPGAIDRLIEDNKGVSDRLKALLEKTEGDTAKSLAGLATIANKISSAKTNFDAMSQGLETLQNKAFGCSALGDVALAITTVDFSAPQELGQNKDWREGIKELVAAVNKTSKSYECP